MFGKEVNDLKPGQLYHLGAEGVSCERLDPAPTLASHIHFFWLLHVTSPEVNLDVIPDAAVDLVMSPDLQGFAAVYLPASEKFTIPLQGPVRYAGICFDTESALEIFGLSRSDLSNLEPGLPTAHALGLSELIDSLQGVNKMKEIGMLFNNHFLEVQQTKSLESRPAYVQTLIDHVPAERISEVAKRIGMSERQLRRTTTDLIGLSPKQIQRILRLQSSLHQLVSQMQNQETDMFYDDSHRIREVKQLTGLTPGQIRKLAEKYNK